MLAEVDSQSSPSSSEPEGDLDIFIKTPSYPTEPEIVPDTVAQRLKHLLSTAGQKIQLSDYVSNLIRRAAIDLSAENFPPSGPVTNEEFAGRLQRYEGAIEDLVTAAILLAHWAEPNQLSQLEKIFARIAELERPQGGTVVWLRLTWYPILLLMYAGGISALAARNYDALRTVLLTRVDTGRTWEGEERPPLVLPVVSELTEIVNEFKRLLTWNASTWHEASTFLRNCSQC